MRLYELIEGVKEHIFSPFAPKCIGVFSCFLYKETYLWHTDDTEERRLTQINFGCTVFAINKNKICVNLRPSVSSVCYYI